jgi:hypothetical protein
MNCVADAFAGSPWMAAPESRLAGEPSIAIFDDRTRLVCYDSSAGRARRYKRQSHNLRLQFWIAQGVSLTTDLANSMIAHGYRAIGIGMAGLYANVGWRRSSTTSID